MTVYTTIDCDNDYGGYSKVRIFNNATTARVCTVQMPKGLLITLSQYWPATYAAIAIGIFLLVGGIINAATEHRKKWAELKKPPEHEAKPPAAA